MAMSTAPVVHSELPYFRPTSATAAHAAICRVQPCQLFAVPESQNHSLTPPHLKYLTATDEPLSDVWL